MNQHIAVAFERALTPVLGAFVRHKWTGFAGQVVEICEAEGTMILLDHGTRFHARIDRYEIDATVEPINVK